MNKGNNLRTLLQTTLSGSTFISIDLLTDTKLNMTVPTEEGRVSNPFYNKVQHQSTVSCQIFQNKVKNGYEEKVKRQMIKEGKDPATFQLQPRKWGTRLPNLPIIEHNGHYYLEVIIHKTTHSEYTFNGKPINYKEIKGWPSTGNPENSQGGIEEKVQIRSLKLASIQQIRIDGQQLSDLYFE